MFILFLIVFINLVGFGIIIPLLPFYGEHYGAQPDTVALLMATYSATQFFTAPTWGRLSDRHGRRPILLISLAGTVASYIWLAFATDLTQLFWARALGGFMAGSIGVSFAYIADVTTPENRAKGMGLIGAAFGLGFIAGPAIGGLLSGSDPATASYQLPSLAAAAFSLAALVAAFAILKESLPPERRSGAPGTGRRRAGPKFFETLRQPQFRVLIGLSFLAVFVFAGLEATFALWSERAFGWGPRQNGYIFAFTGLIGAVIQGLLIGPLTKRFGEARLVLQGFAALALGLAIIPFSTGLVSLLTAMVIVAYGFSVSTPALNSLISLRAAASDQGGILGISRSMTTLSRALGPAWAGFLFASFGKQWPFLTGALIMIVVFALSLKYWPLLKTGKGRQGPTA